MRSPTLVGANYTKFGETERPMKVVMFPLNWVLAHVGRCIEIGKVLRARGHEVVIAGEDPTHPMSRLDHAQKEGFRTVYVREPAWHWAWERFHKHGVMTSVGDLLRNQQWAPLEEITEDIIRVAKEERADLLVGDASMGVSTAGRILNIPAAGVINAYNAEFMKPWSYQRAGVRIFEFLQWGPARRRVYKNHGVAAMDPFKLMEETPIISPDLKEFHKPVEGFELIQPVGPIISETPFDLPEWYDELSDGRPNVYITMGSTGLLEQLLLRCYEAMGKSKYRFVVTTGDQVTQETMDKAPDNFRFASYAPGTKLLEQCCCMIYHGGNGSMYQALGAGVPMLALPSHMEQQIGTKLVLDQGFSIRDCSRKIKGEQLLAHVERLATEHEFKANAWRLRHLVHASRGAEHAADILEAHARKAALKREACAL